MEVSIESSLRSRTRLNLCLGNWPITKVTHQIYLFNVTWNAGDLSIKLSNDKIWQQLKSCMPTSRTQDCIYPSMNGLSVHTWLWDCVYITKAEHRTVYIPVWMVGQYTPGFETVPDSCRYVKVRIDIMTYLNMVTSLTALRNPWRKN